MATPVVTHVVEDVDREAFPVDLARLSVPVVECVKPFAPSTIIEDLDDVVQVEGLAAGLPDIGAHTVSQARQCRAKVGRCREVGRDLLSEWAA